MKKVKANNKKGIIAGIAAVAVVVGGIGLTMSANDNTANTEIVYKETNVQKGNLTVGVTESGSVTIGTLTQEFELGSEGTSNSSQSYSMMGGMSGGTSGNSSTVALEVEEIYVAAGQKVEVGETLFKISEESIEEYRNSLENAIDDAKASLNEAKLTAEKKQLSADYNYSTTVAKGNLAEANYNATLASLQAEIDSIQEEYDYQYALADYYWSLMQNGDDSYSEKHSAAETQKANLQEKLTLAESNYETKVLQAKKEYEETMLNYNNASSQYSIDVNGIDNDVDSAKEALEEANDAL